MKPLQDEECHLSYNNNVVQMQAMASKSASSNLSLKHNSHIIVCVSTSTSSYSLTGFPVISTAAFTTMVTDILIKK